MQILGPPLKGRYSQPGLKPLSPSQRSGLYVVSNGLYMLMRLSLLELLGVFPVIVLPSVHRKCTPSNDLTLRDKNWCKTIRTTS